MVDERITASKSTTQDTDYHPLAANSLSVEVESTVECKPSDPIPNAGPKQSGGMLPFLRRRHCSGRRGKMKRNLKVTAIIVAVLLFVIFVILPIICHYTPSLVRYFIFMNKVGDDINFDEPQEVGLPGTHNFYLETEKDINVGVWHILPESLVHSVPQGTLEKHAMYYESTLESNNQPVILYMHGNKGSRGQSRRVELYNILRLMGYHVITFDYRGYADSAAVTPTETGLVFDAKAVYNYLINRTKTSLVFVWGHSLGTGVACNAVSQLCQERKCPGGVILESPFNNIEEEVRRNPLSVLFRGLPYFDWAFIQPLKEIDVQFQSDEHIHHITAPIMILHAKDDRVVPFDLGKKLQTAAQSRRSPDLMPIKFIEFDSKYGYGHNHISKAPELTSLIRGFISDSMKELSMKRIHVSNNRGVH